MGDGMIGTFQPQTAESDSGSIADHEAAWGPDGTRDAREPASEPGSSAETEHATEPDTARAQTPADATDDRTRDASGRYIKPPRHRARSQQASPEDVPRIKELTAKHKEADARVKQLETELQTLRTAPRAPQAETPRQETRPEPQQAPQLPLTRPEPTEDEIGTKYPTYAAFTRDQAQWVQEQFWARKEWHDQRAAQWKDSQERLTTYQTQKAAFLTAHADYPQVMAAVAHIGVPAVMMEAILRSPRALDVEYWLGTHQEDFLALAQEALPLPNTPEVARMVQRVLESRLPVAPAQRSQREAAGQTGAAPAPQTTPAPRPPTPVRTGPMPIGDETPDDSSSLSEHEKFYARRRR